MRRRAFLALTACAGAARRGWAGSAPPVRRIASLAPSLTESLFALGLGARVAAVTSYCAYPPEAARLPRVGGYLTPSWEALAAARPDLVLVLPEHDDLRPQLSALGAEVLRLDHRRISGIVDGLRVIAARCGADAGPLVRELSTRLGTVERVLRGRPRPRVLAVLGRQGDRAGFRSALGGGPGGLHDDLVARAGGTNVLAGSPVPYPSLSAEGLLRLDPDAVVELAPGGGDPLKLLEEWQPLASLRAVRQGRVLPFTHEFLAVPGPRFVRFVGEVARAVHPRAPWARP